MNTKTIKTMYEWPAATTGMNRESVKHWANRVPVSQVLGLGSRWLVAAVPVAFIMAASAWAIGTFNSAVVLEAIIWVTGFVFLALAMESRKLNFEGLLATGLALPVLALLSAHVAVEFAMLGAALIAGWVAAAIIRR